MLKMKTKKMLFLFIQWFLCVSSNSEAFKEISCKSFCQTSQLKAPLGSSVVLPCIFPSNIKTQVNWTQNGEKDLVALSSGSRVNFQDPRYGRVKVFPFQASQGDFSICIDEIRNSDLGCYLCKHANGCLQVELLEYKPSGTVSEMMLLIIFICIVCFCSTC